MKEQFLAYRKDIQTLCKHIVTALSEVMPGYENNLHRLEFIQKDARSIAHRSMLFSSLLSRKDKAHLKKLLEACHDDTD